MDGVLEQVAIKAYESNGKWRLDIRALPFGGPNGGRDSHGEYFSPRTEIHAEKFSAPPLVYYHGFGDRTTMHPVYIGFSAGRWEKRSDGWWITGELDPAVAEARKVWEAAKAGKVAVSSGSAPHLVRYGQGGEILEWPPIEISLWEMDGMKSKPANAYACAIPATKAVYTQAGLAIPSELDQAADDLQDGGIGEQQPASTGDSGEELAIKRGDEMADVVVEPKPMTADEIRAIAAEAVKAEREQREAEERAKREKDELDALKAENAKLKDEAAEARRLPGGAPYVAKHNDIWKYDNLEPADHALLIGILNAPHNDIPMKRASAAAMKAAAVKAFEDKGTVGEVGRQAIKMAGIHATKADEVMQQDLTAHGDEWVGIMYSQKLWEVIRQETFVVDSLPSIEVPAGNESIKIPLEAADMTFYKVAEVTDLNGTTGRPNATVTASQTTTGQKTLSLAKMGARTLWSGELEEDSLIPWVEQLRKQMTIGAAEQLEHVIIDGDTDASATTNINDIAGTPAGTEAFLLVNGFRKSPLVTTTANSVSIGTLTAEKFLSVVKLMGLGGKNARQKDRVSFILDLWTHWKALELPEVKTRDVNIQATVENGDLTRIYGYNVKASAFMHYANQDATYGLKAQTNGKIDLDTAADNIAGAILAVRWDQWLMGWRRRITIETSRYPESDANQIVGMLRFGLAQRDTEASAIGYNVTV